MATRGLRTVALAGLAAVTCALTTGGQTLYSIGTPTNDEQFMLELLNRARVNGNAEATRLGISSVNEGPPTLGPDQWTIMSVTQPLSWNPKLQASAQGQADVIQNGDQFFSGQSPHTFGGTTPQSRIAAAGYQQASFASARTSQNGFLPGPEAVAAEVSQGSGPYTGARLTNAVRTAHEGLFTDLTVPGRGHRSTMMYEFWREVGIGVSTGTDQGQGQTWDSVYVVQNYGTQSGNATAGPFVTGVVYHDTNGNGFYDPGEGLPGITVNVSGSNFFGMTSSSGGYSVPVATNGTFTVSFSGSGVPNNTRTAVIANLLNAKVDDVVAPKFANISTRMNVRTGENVLIGGFIITGVESKRVLFRAIGPSLTSVANPLSDPILELYQQGNPTPILTNDNWQDAPNRQAIIDTTAQPTNSRESAILTTLAPGSYTAIVRGANGGTGVGLVEGFDLESMSPTRFANISTRGFVETGDNVMIGGFIVLQEAKKVIVRAIGPSLPVTNKLANPFLELHDSNGGLITANDNWQDSQVSEITATGVPPTNDLESALVRTLAPGNYTAVVRGVSGGTGVALVEVYGLN